MPAVIEWHQSGLVPLGARLFRDHRCSVIEADFFALALDPMTGFDPVHPGEKVHAVLLDIDHSPQNLLHQRHAGFYSPAGLAALADQLEAGGAFAMWSDDPPDESFMHELRKVFGEVISQVVSFPNPILERESSSTVYVAHKMDQAK